MIEARHLELRELEIKEVETVKYYLLFKYNSAREVRYRYFLWNQSEYIEEIENSKDDKHLNEGEQWRTYVIDMPV